MGHLAAAERIRRGRMQPQSQDQHDRVIRWWHEFLKSVGYGNDPWLDNETPKSRCTIVCAFAQAMRDGEFSKEGNKGVGAGKIGNTIGKLSQMFRLNFWQRPAHDEHGKMFALLSAQIKGYKGLDPLAKHKQQSA